MLNKSGFVNHRICNQLCQIYLGFFIRSQPGQMSIDTNNKDEEECLNSKECRSLVKLFQECANKIEADPKLEGSCIVESLDVYECVEKCLAEKKKK